MTLEGANKLNETNEYIFYAMNSVTTGQYGVVVPQNINGTLNMLVDLHMKGSFDEVGSGTKVKDEFVKEIDEEYTKLKTKHSDGMLVMPMIDEESFKNIVLNDDKQKMFDEVKKIGVITSELYKKLTEQGVDKSKIDQKIIIVEKSEEDKKFVEWLKVQMPNYVDGIELSSIVINANPFANSIFGPAPEPAATVETEKNENLFQDVVVTTEQEVAPTPAVSSEPVVPTVEPVIESASATPAVEIPALDVFGTQAQVEPVVTPTPIVENEVAPAPVEVSVPPVVDNTAPSVTQDVVTNTVTKEVPVPATSVAPTSTPEVVTQSPEPTPVSPAALEGTIAFTPIPNHPNNSVNEQATLEQSNDAPKKSKGFVNLAILLVVLVGVTLISIELGKYLYSVYGA